MSASHLVDDGISGQGNRGTEYWPTVAAEANQASVVEATQLSWWEKSNWFRIQSKETSETQSKDQNSATLSSIALNVPTQEYVANDLNDRNKLKNSSIHAPGHATVFNRFITSTKKNITQNSSEKQKTYNDPVEKPKKLKLDALRGYSAEVMDKLNELIVLPFCYPQMYSAIGIPASRAILLTGAIGTGKTVLVKSIVKELGVHFHHIDGANLLASADQVVPPSSQITDSSLPSSRQEYILDTVFKSAWKHAPSLIFIDELDVVVPTPQRNDSPIIGKLRSQLRAHLDKLSQSPKPIIVIGATNRPDAIDPILLSSSRFSRTIVLNKPDEKGRLLLLQSICASMKLNKDVNLQQIAANSIGFVAGDLQALCTEAGLQCIRENLEMENSSEEENAGTPIKTINTENMNISHRHFELARKIITPSSTRTFNVEVDPTPWNSIGGNEDIKSTLIETVEYPLTYSHLYKHFGLPSSSGVLLYGPPGCGKTLMARAIAKQSKASFISIKGPEVLNSYLGESEKRIRELFIQARAASPCVLFFDEIDSIAQRRHRASGSDATTDRVLNQLLIEMDSRPLSSASNSKNLKPKTVGNNEPQSNTRNNPTPEPVVFVIAATNRPELLDPALLRPGRLDQLLFIGMPDFNARVDILKANLSNTPTEARIYSEYIETLAAQTERFSGADLAALVNKARTFAIRQHLSRKCDTLDEKDVVTVSHLEAALAEARPSVTDSQLELYKYYNSAIRNNFSISDVMMQAKHEEYTDNDSKDDMKYDEYDEKKERVDDEKGTFDPNNFRQTVVNEVVSQTESGASPQQALNHVMKLFRS